MFEVLYDVCPRMVSYYNSSCTFDAQPSFPKVILKQLLHFESIPWLHGRVVKYYCTIVFYEYGYLSHDYYGKKIH